MGYYTEQGQKLEIFNDRYKVKLLLGMQVKQQSNENANNESIVYLCKKHDKIYKIFESLGKLGCSEIDSLDTIIPENITGIGSGEEITVDDLDAMFDDWENYCKNLKPATEENINELLDAEPELEEPLTMEMFWFSKKSFSQLMKDIEDEYNSLTGRSNRVLRDKLKNKIDGAFTAYGLEKAGVRPDVKRGEIWKATIPIGIGSETYGYRYVVIISRDLHAMSSKTVNVVNIVSAIDHNTKAKKPIKEEWQIEITNADLQDGTLADDSFVNFADIKTVDKLELETKIGKVKDECLKRIIDKVAQQIAVFPEPIELDVSLLVDDEE